MTASSQSTDARPGDLVFVLYGDITDREVAEQMADRMRSFAYAWAYTFDEFASLVPALMPGVPKGLIPGISLTIISGNTLTNPALRQSAAALCRRLYHQPFYSHYCAVQGTNSALLQSDPLFAGLFEHMTIHQLEIGKDALLDDIRRNIESPDPRSDPFSSQSFISQWLRYMSGTLVGFPFVLLWSFCNFLVLISLSYSIGLLVLLVGGNMFAWFDPFPSWSCWLIVLSLFSAGWRANSLAAPDLWPFVAKSWRLPEAPRASKLTLPIGLASAAAFGGAAVIALNGEYFRSAVTLATGMLVQALIDLYLRWRHGRFRGQMPMGTSSDASDGLATITHKHGYPPSAYDRLKYAFSYSTTVNLRAILLRPIPAVVSVYLAASQDVYLLLLPFTIGLLAPTMMAPLIRLFWSSWAWHSGLTQRDARQSEWALRLGASMFPKSSGDVIEGEEWETFTRAERAQAAYWIVSFELNIGRTLLRFLRTPKDSAFISYTWHGDKGRTLAAAVEKSCAMAGIEVTLDRAQGSSKAGLWRRTLAVRAQDCTHCFLIVSPEIGLGTVVLRELDLFLQRWVNERRPSVICVGDAEAVEAVRKDPSVPFRVRLLLTICPRLSEEEAGQPYRVKSVVELTRRMGLGRELLVFLSPSTLGMQLPRVARD